MTHFCLRPLVPPAPRRQEFALPNTPARCSCAAFLTAIAPVRDGEAVGNHRRAQVLRADLAAGKDAAVAITPLARARHRSGRHQGGEPVAGDAAARPVLACRAAAGLVEFRGIKADEADTCFAQPQAVAIGRAGPALEPLRWRFEQRSHHCRGGQQEKAEERAEKRAFPTLSEELQMRRFTLP